MAINTPQQLWQHELQDIYDAEHQFLNGQKEMLSNATDPKLQQMLTEHIRQTEGQIANLEQVLGNGNVDVVGEGLKRMRRLGQQKLFKETGVEETLATTTAGLPADRSAKTVSTEAPISTAGSGGSIAAAMSSESAS